MLVIILKETDILKIKIWKTKVVENILAFLTVSYMDILCFYHVQDLLSSLSGFNMYSHVYMHISTSTDIMILTIDLSSLLTGILYSRVEVWDEAPSVNCGKSLPFTGQTCGPWPPSFFNWKEAHHYQDF